MALEVGVTTCVPEVAVDVVHEAEQLVALVDDQVRVEDCPAVMVVGEAERVTVGVRAVNEFLTVTVTAPEVVTLPEVSLAVAVKVCVSAGGKDYKPCAQIWATQKHQHLNVCSFSK